MPTSSAEHCKFYPSARREQIGVTALLPELSMYWVIIILHNKYIKKNKQRNNLREKYTPSQPKSLTIHLEKLPLVLAPQLWWLGLHSTHSFRRTAMARPQPLPRP